jgi:hypothetical protein
MNVHKRCKPLVANTCGVNPRLMADILHDMGMSVNKLNLPKGKSGPSKDAKGKKRVEETESDADLDRKFDTQLKIAAQVIVMSDVSFVTLLPPG